VVILGGIGLKSFGLEEYEVENDYCRDYCQGPKEPF